MSGKAKYVKVSIQSDAKSLAGYTVLGDVTAAGGRQLLLERPEAAAGAPARKRPATKKVASTHPASAAGGKSTSFEPTTMAGVGPTI